MLSSRSPLALVGGSLVSLVSLGSFGSLGSLGSSEPGDLRRDRHRLRPRNSPRATRDRARLDPVTGPLLLLLPTTYSSSSSSTSSLLTSLSSQTLLSFLPSSRFRLLPLSFLLAPCRWYLLVPQLAEAGWRVRFSDRDWRAASSGGGRTKSVRARALAEPREASLPILSAEEF